MFADLSELTRNRPAGPDARTDTQVHSPREYFHTYLQSLDAERAGLPDAFQHRLSQVLGHYGVTSLERTPELEDAVFRIFLAQRRAASDAAVMTALLRQWLTEPPPGEPLRERAGLTLEHLIAATQLRFPAVADLARSVVFRWFAQPLLRRSRAQVYAAVARTSATWTRTRTRRTGVPDRRDGGQLGAAGAAARAADRPPGAGLAPMLEVLTRRYYGSKALPACGPASGRAARSSPPSTRTKTAGHRACHRGGLRGAAAAVRAIDELARPATRSPTSTSPGPASRTTRTRWRPSCMPCWPRIGCPASCAGLPPPWPGAAARDAPPLHVPAVARRDHRRAADPRPAPADRPPDAAGTAAALRPDPAALGRRGRLPVRCVAPATRPTNGSSRWPRCA